MGEDLWALACSVGQEPVKAELVTPLPSRHEPGSFRERAAFRVEYRDGLRLKARRHRDLETAERVLLLRSFLDVPHFPAMVAARGSCHLTEWVQGGRPSADDPDVLLAAGTLLGTVHSVVMEPEVGRYRFEYQNWERRNRRNADELVASKAMTRAEMEAVLERLAAVAPGHCHAVAVLADLAPENLVVGPEGRLFLVDDENLSLDSPGFDLARTWYRWPMTDLRAGPFLAGYGTCADPSPFLEFAEYWIMVVLLEAAHFRTLWNTPEASAPLDALRARLGSHLRYPPEPEARPPGGCGHSTGGSA
jgi:hypothetical protein